MRKLWIKLVHGGHTSKAEDASSGVDSDPAPGYRWVIHPVDSWGDLPVALERHNGKTWKEVNRTDIRSHYDYSTEVPRVKQALWKLERSKVQRKNSNDAWLADNT